MAHNKLDHVDSAEPTDKVQLKLPASVVTTVDLNRTEREIKAIEDFVVQSAIRQAGHQPELPRISRSAEELAKLNHINLLKDQDRAVLLASLKGLMQTAPVFHISFASEPNPTFLAKIINWFRSEIHPHSFIQLGLQPNIAAGCIVRTANKQFDLSLRKRLLSQGQLLTEKIAQGGD